MKASMLFVLTACVFLTGCNGEGFGGKKPPPGMTAQNGAALKFELERQASQQEKMLALLEQQKFRDMGVDLCIGEGDDKIILTVPKDKEGKDRDVSSVVRALYNATDKIEEEVEAQRKKREERMKKSCPPQMPTEGNWIPMPTPIVAPVPTSTGPSA